MPLYLYKNQRNITTDHVKDLKRRIGTICALIATIIILLAASHTPAYSEVKKPPPLHLDNRIESYSLPRYMSYCFDKNGDLSIEDATARENELFRPLNNTSVNLGLRDDVLWLRFELAGSNPDDEWFLDMDRPLEQQIALFFQDGSGQWQVLHSCSEPPCQEGLLPRRPVFPLPSLSSTPTTFFLRIKTPTSLQFFPKISTPVAFWERSKIQYLGQGLYFGLCLAMILYNLSIFVYLGDRTYLYYVMYVLCLAGYFSVTHGALVEHVLFISVPNLIKMDLVCLGLSIAIAALFARAFLMTRKHSPWSDRVMLAYMLLALTGSLLTPFVKIQTILPLYNLLGGLGPLVTVIPAVICLRRGFRPARFFIAAYAFFTGGVVVFVSSYAGLIPLSNWAFHAFQIGSALEIIILALALGDRIRALRKEKEALAESQKYYKKTSILDGLTGLYNRRCYEERILEEVRKARQFHQPLSLLMADIDNFKSLNDTYGHQQGDVILIELADTLKKNSRSNDIPCRYGGEEFVLILPQTELTSACRAAERIRDDFFLKTFYTGKNPALKATVSIGAAELDENDDADSLLKKADDALYQAKRTGRNRVRY